MDIDIDALEQPSAVVVAVNRVVVQFARDYPRMTFPMQDSITSSHPEAVKFARFHAWTYPTQLTAYGISGTLAIKVLALGEALTN